MAADSAALVGACGGAGATRLTVELGGLLARDGRDVVLLDAAFATQGLARHVGGRIDPDATALAADPDVALDDALLSHPATDDVPGRLRVCAAHAPFAALAEAKAPGAAERFGDSVASLADRVDHVLVDTPPVAANQAVAAATTAERVAVVYPPTDRGVDALQRARGRLADVGAALDCVVANRADGEEPPPDADRAVPTAEAAAPAALGADPLTPAVASLAEALLDVELEVDASAGLVDAARRRLQ